VCAGFLGSPAKFPASPFIVAKLFRVPVFLVLAGVDGDGYQVIVEPLADVATAAEDRDAYVRRGVERFAARLEHHVQRSPYNWFNFFDFWRA
jgi:predicted LPLAT superfamily acyltransferase